MIWMLCGEAWELAGRIAEKVAALMEGAVA